MTTFTRMRNTNTLLQRKKRKRKRRKIRQKLTKMYKIQQKSFNPHFLVILSPGFCHFLDFVIKSNYEWLFIRFEKVRGKSPNELKLLMYTIITLRPETKYKVSSR